MKSITFGRCGSLVLSNAFVTSAPLGGCPGAATSEVRVGGVGSEVAWLGLLGLPRLLGWLGLLRLSGLLELLGLLVLLGLLGNEVANFASEKRIQLCPLDVRYGWRSRKSQRRVEACGGVSLIPLDS